jgi:hypothetical protein
MVDGCSDWDKGCDGKEAGALEGAFIVTYTGAGFMLLVLWNRNADGAAPVGKLCKGTPMADKFFVVKTTSECGVCLVEELIGRRWSTEGSWFSGMMVFI